jgi:hypothetical protein
MDQKHGEEKIFVWADAMGEMLCEFSHENSGLEGPEFFFPWGAEAIQNRIATCFFRTAQVKHLSKDQKADLIHCRHLLCLKCPKELAWADGQSIGVPEILQLDSRPGKLRLDERNQIAGSSS